MKQVAATVLSRVRSVAQDCSCGGCADGKLYCVYCDSDRILGAQAPCAGGELWPPGGQRPTRPARYGI